MMRLHPAQDRPAAPVCSVCIANYNGEALLGDCLASVFAQAGDLAVEVIVHDDASTDASRELLKAYRNVTWIESTQNVGFCVSNNRMVAQARGEFVLLLNNDAALLPGALKALRSLAGSSTAPAILTLPQFDWDSHALVDRGCLLDPFYNPIPHTRSGPDEVAMVIGACLWLPRSLWIELGGFPEWLGSVGEDLWLCCAARRRGYGVRVTGDSGYRHRQGASFGGNRAQGGRLSTTLRRRTLSERNKSRALLTFTPAWLRWPLWTLHSALLTVEGLALTAVHRDRRIWRDIYGPALLTPWTDRQALAAERAKLAGAPQATLRSYLSAFRPWPRKLAMLLAFGVPKIR